MISLELMHLHILVPHYEPYNVTSQLRQQIWMQMQNDIFKYGIEKNEVTGSVSQIKSFQLEHVIIFQYDLTFQFYLF